MFKNKLDEENAILSELSHDDESVKHVAVAQYLQVHLHIPNLHMYLASFPVLA